MKVQKQALAFVFCLLTDALAPSSRAAEPPDTLRRAVNQLLTALQKADEKRILSLTRTPQAFGAEGILSNETRAHLFERPHLHARSIAELAKDWGIQSQVRVPPDGSAIALFHTWGTKVESLRDDCRVSYFVCKFQPTPAEWKMHSLCSD